ncbi:MAG TPA: SulP family inorganic anion transporter [Gemmatimonadales bacterium]|nr:SulP family inorganic anion transporter [Gemmatimonadales bacterium]
MTDRTDPAERERAEPAVDQPGLGELREAVATHLRRRFAGPASWRDDGIAGLSVGIANVPDGMANGLLVGVSPIYGLYAAMIGPLVGGIVSSTQLMVITTTAAASLTASQSLRGVPADTRAAALFALVVLAGACLVAAGLLGLGRITHFVSYSVLTGFLAGISILLVLSQLPTVTGYAAQGGNKVTQTADLVAHAGAIDPASVAVAAFTLVLAVLLPRTRLGAFGRLIAIAVPSAIVALAGLASVRVVSDVGAIPRSVPWPELPELVRFAPAVITGALSLALVVLVQGVGVSQTVPTPGGGRTSVRRDLVAQGAANVVSGLFHGLPVGGSLSATALGVIAGARSRWASIIAGLGMAGIVLGVPGLVSLVAMPSLGALLILAGFGGLKPRELLAVGRTGWPSLLAATTTFLATLLLPIQAAVGLGVVLSALLYVGTASTDVFVVELRARPDGKIEERPAPSRLTSGETTTLDVYGHLFYAGARTLERLLPSPRDARRPVVILRLRGRHTLGATLIEVLAHYADELREAGGRLYLTGITRHAYDQIVRTGKLRLTGPVRAYEATPVIGESTREARADAETWLVGSGDDVS